MKPSTVITPGRQMRRYWADVWSYRELFLILAWRDLAVRYKQTVIGVAWAVIRPALTMLVFVAFRRLLGIRSEAVPDSVLVLGAVLPWQFFSSALSESSGSLLSNSSLISKVYFPRLIIPCASVATTFVDFLITLAMLAVLMVVFRVAPGPQLALLPLFVLLTLALSIGLGLFVAALNVEYRDFRHLVPFIVQFGLFISPVAFTTQSVPEQWRGLYSLNPMVGIIDGFRWTLFGGRTPLDGRVLLVSFAVTALTLVVGLRYFRRVERRFADYI